MEMLDNYEPVDKFKLALRALTTLRKDVLRDSKKLSIEHSRVKHQVRIYNKDATNHNARTRDAKNEAKKFLFLFANLLHQIKEGPFPLLITNQTLRNDLHTALHSYDVIWSKRARLAKYSEKLEIRKRKLEVRMKKFMKSYNATKSDMELLKAI